MDDMSSIQSQSIPGIRAALTDELRVAVIGTGSMGMRHLRVLDKMPGVRPVAVPIRLQRISQLEQAGYRTARDLSEASRGGATICIVATDTGRHAKDGHDAFQAGLDLLVEKPMAVDAVEAGGLRDQAASLSRKIYVACVLRFSESLNTMRGLINDIGRLHSVRIECQSYLPDWRPARSYLGSYAARSGEGGVLRDLIHEIDYAGWIFGWPKSVQARVRNLGRLSIEAEEAAELFWEISDGCLVSLRLDYLTRPPKRSIRAFGEFGTLEWNGISNTVTLAISGNEEKSFTFSQTRDEMLLAQDRAFIEASAGSCDPRLATAEDGIRALAVCDAARRASETRREEPVEYL